MDTAQWPQGIGVVENVVETTRVAGAEKKPRPEKEKALNCPRCNSTNTKFCYYNNYSLSQPRYFCKTCRRYWTEGGSLRNVPVGGGSRKNRRPSSSSFSSSTSSSTSKKLPEHSAPSPCFPLNPNNAGQDLNLTYPPPNSGILHHLNPFHIPMPVSDPSSTAVFSSGFLFPLHDVKPAALDGFGNGNNGFVNHVEESGARVFFPNLEDLKSGFEQYRGHGESNGFWNGTHGGSAAGGGGGGGGW